MINNFKRDFTLCIVVFLYMAGCSSAPSKEDVAKARDRDMARLVKDKPQPLQRLYLAKAREGQRNAVLNEMRIGVAAMEIGDYIGAEQSFDKALQSIESVYANNATAKEARSLWSKENKKDFKGEPYERAMAYYYRGLLYVRRGDYENAAASFKGGMLQDAVAEKEEFRADFAALAFLEGWAAQCMGNPLRAQELYTEARSFKPKTSIPGVDDTTLLIAELGASPIKVLNGKYREQLFFARGQPALEQDVVFEHNNNSINTTLNEDIFWQATTRGGRQFDAILEGKASFKETTATVGTVATTAGAASLAAGYIANNEQLKQLGGIGLIAGLASSATSEAVKPEADGRYWDNLPDSVRIATARLLSDSAVNILYLDGNGRALPGRTIVATPAGTGRCNIVWTRGHSALAIGDNPPNGAPLLITAEDSEKMKEAELLRTQEERRQKDIEEFTYYTGAF